MTIEEAIFSYLSTYAGLVPLISTKVFPDVVPQSVELPAIVYTFISSDKPRSTVCGHHGFSNDIYQIAIYAKTRAGVIAIKEEVRKALLGTDGAGYHGLMGTLHIKQCVDVGGLRGGYDKDADEYYDQTDYQFTYEY